MNSNAHLNTHVHIHVQTHAKVNVIQWPYYHRTIVTEEVLSYISFSKQYKITSIFTKLI